MRLAAALGLAASVSALVVSAPARAEDEVAQLRYLSMAIRDRFPSPDEARAFAAATDKARALDDLARQWLESPEHLGRVERHFNDMFGIEPWVFLAEGSTDLIQHDPAAPVEAPADLETAGVWHLPASVKATCGTPVQASAWWSDAPIQICSTAVSSAIMFSSGAVRCWEPYAATGIRDPQCGCGPDQIICYPRHLKKNAVRAVAREFADRARHAYEMGRGWLDLFGGADFVGDRWLYHHYLYQERVVVKGELPSTAELSLLRSLPVAGQAVAAFPTGGPERSGVATSPAFMRRFNNVRSRIRALTEQLLCKDIDPTLNSDGIDHFVNPSLLASDFDREHGAKEGCSSCHYALDNFASTILGWNDLGFYEAWAPKSQLGHVFGETGTGPRFLVQSYVERGSGFLECMARKTWEGFSGATWDDLGDGERSAFVQAAAAGPREAIRAVLLSDALVKRRARTTSTTTTSEAVRYDFAADVAPILAASCAGSVCHSADNPRGSSSAYVGNEAAFKLAPVDRISSGSMPPAGSGMTLSDEARGVLVLFLQQK